VGEGSGIAAVEQRDDRQGTLRLGLRLEWLTVGWNVVEGMVAVFAALSAGSVALLGFGIDSFVESASGTVLIWRLRAERRTSVEQIERIERRAQRLVAVSLFGLAIYIAAEAAVCLIAHERPGISAAGIAVTILSLGVMWWLARAKRDAARALGSRALEADAVQTAACFWLSLIVLSGVALNAAFGWWWADPLAALGMTYFLVREARGAWRGDECCP
jgi:divalent metal cation (Fe/Co/Zn/Cd) transporter